ncbi:MAG: acyl-CoA thioesterase [Burkholderiales bacterium]
MKFELPERKTLVQEMTFPIRWGDMDAMGHVNNAVYFKYLESARIDWLRSVGREPDASGEGIVIANAFCNFYRQLEYPNEVLLKTFISDPGRTTIESWGTMEYAREPGIIRAAGGATMIWVDFPKQKAANLPDWLRKLAE